MSTDHGLEPPLHQALFKTIGEGILGANINYEYALKDAVKAHEALESGRTLGATVLIP